MFRNLNSCETVEASSLARGDHAEEKEEATRWPAVFEASRTTSYGRVHPDVEIRAPPGAGCGYLNLKPLRELDKNFDIDIASCLQEYLAELSIGTNLEDDSATAGQSMTDNFQQEHHRNGFTCTNFTNAAILLQNSSSVYSRKVEYLYSLVYQTLQDLNSKCHVGKSGDNIFGGGNESNPSRFKRLDPDIEQFECFDPNWNFLMFDENTLPLDTKGDIIDLPPSSSDYAWEAGDVEDENDNAAFHGKQGKNLFTSSVYLDQHKQRCQLQDTTIMNSSTLTQSVGKLSIIQQRKQQQQWMRQYMEQQPVYIGGGEEVTFKLLNGMCHVSDTGALLLPGTINHDDESQRKTHESVSNDRNSSVQQLDFYNDLGDDDDNGITGWEIHPHSPTMANTDRCEQSLTRKDTSCGDVIDGQRNENVNIPLLEKNIQSITLDPWDLLDPHDVSQSKYRPMKAITTFCLPNGVDQLPSFAATGFKINDVKNTKKKNNCTDLKELQEEELDASFCETLESSGLAVKGYRAVLCRVRDNDEAMDTSAAECELMEPFSYKKTKPLSLHTLAYGSEFHYILKSQSKRKAANRKKQKQTHLKYRNETAEVIDASERFHDMYGDNDDDDDDDDDNHDGPAFDFVDDHESTDLQTPNENNVKDCHVDAFDGVFVNEKTFGDRTFEELCRAHLKEFAKGAEKFAVESQLSKRVSNWQSKIENVLCVEERRPEFNIHTYGTQIITNARLCIDQQRSVVKQSTMVPGFQESHCLDEINFASITKDKEPYDVCRTFLASLMLCNSENIILRTHATGRQNNMDSHVSSPDNLFLKVLNTEIHHL